MSETICCTHRNNFTDVLRRDCCLKCNRGKYVNERYESKYEHIKDGHMSFRKTNSRTRNLNIFDVVDLGDAAKYERKYHCILLKEFFPINITIKRTAISNRRLSLVDSKRCRVCTSDVRIVNFESKGRERG